MGNFKRILMITTKILLVIYGTMLAISFLSAVYLIIDIGHIPEVDDPLPKDISYISWFYWIGNLAFFSMLITLLIWIYLIFNVIYKIIRKRIKKKDFFILFICTILLIYLIVFYDTIIAWLYFD